MNSPDLLQRFLRHLHRGGKYWYLWVGQTRESLWGDVDHAIPVPTGNVDVYFGVHPTAKRGSANERARIGDIAAINAIIAEFDAKDYSDKRAALQHIGTLGLKPSVIIDSGGGYHCYWLLREPFPIQSVADRERARHLQAEWVPLVGGDTAAKDLARVLRFPGSHNCKAQYAPDYPQVTFVDADLNLLYAIDDLEQLLPVHHDHLQTHSATAQSSGDAYANTALKNELGILMLTTEGHRNDQLNRSAFALGQLIGAGRLDRSAVEQVLLRTATAIGLAQRESLATIQSGIEAGAKRPRVIPDHHNGHERTTDNQRPSLPLSQALDAQVAQLAKLPREQRGDGLRILFGSLAALDDFAQSHFRSRLGQALGIKKREFDDYLRATRKASRSPNLNGDRYKIEDGRLCAICFDREGVPQTVPLCNFVACIIAEEERDDGRDISRRLVIEGISDHGKLLPSIYVETTEFDNVAKWAIKGWGSSVVVRAGQSTRDKLREAIQVHSLACGIESRKVFTHLGWRTIAGRRVYLTSNGALGVAGVCVDLDEPSWQRYELPQDILDPARSMRDSVEFLSIADLTVTVPLWSAIWLAPIVSILQPSHVIWLHGSTGNMKSTIAALALSHYGTFDHLSLPTSWLDTGNELEKALFVAKDAPIVIDDFAPQQNGKRAAEIEDNAQRIVRAVGNHTGRRRLNRDLSLLAPFEPRGLVMATGEQLPSGTSTMARFLVVDIERKQIDLGRLTEAQEKASRYPHATAGYLNWLADQWEALERELPIRFREIRQEELSEAHARLPGVFALHHLGLDLGLQYAVYVGALTETESDAWLSAGDSALHALIEKQATRVVSEKPTLRFLQVLGELLTQKAICIADLHGPSMDPPAGTELIGWQDEEYLYLLPSATYHRVAAYSKTEGGFFPVKPNTLYRDLQADGYLVSIRGEHTGIARVAGGEAKRVMKLTKSKLHEVWGLSL